MDVEKQSYLADKKIDFYLKKKLLICIKESFDIEYPDLMSILLKGKEQYNKELEELTKEKLKKKFIKEKNEILWLRYWGNLITDITEIEQNLDKYDKESKENEESGNDLFGNA